MPNKPWKNISINIIVQVKSYNTICVNVNKLIKRAYFICIDIKFSSKYIVHLLIDRFYSLHELLLQIISDREIQHSAEIFWKKCKLLEIELTMSTVYHLQTDGQIKYQVLCWLWPKNWSDLLPSTEFAYNNQVYEAINKDLQI